MAKTSGRNAASEQVPDLAEAAQQAFLALYPWQQSLWQHMSAPAGQRGHAWLLAGNVGCGKRRLAWHWAAWYLCHQPSSAGACGQCTSCQWLKAGSHPDLNWITATSAAQAKSEQTSIRIEAIRELLPFVQIAGDRPRIVVIEPAEMLNTAAANALLKALEEPPGRVHFLLISDRPRRLLPTIRSRVQTWQCDRIEPDAARDYLTQQIDAQPAQQQAALYLASYAPLSAVALLEQGLLAQRQQLADQWLALLQRRVSPANLTRDWQALGADRLIHLLRQLLREMIGLKLGVAPSQPDLTLAPLLAHVQSVPLARWFALEDWLLKQLPLLQQNVQPALICASVWQQLQQLTQVD